MAEVVIDDSTSNFSQALLPALEQRLEHIALVELGVADERNHIASSGCGPARSGVRT